MFLRKSERKAKFEKGNAAMTPILGMIDSEADESRCRNDFVRLENELREKEALDCAVVLRDIDHSAE